MDANDLCDQKLVTSVFRPIKGQFPRLNEEIEQIEFLFKNACYNKNKLIEEINKSRKGISFPRDKDVLEIASAMGLRKAKQTLSLGVPFVVWADIIVFEFHACLGNIMRTVNFLLSFKLKYWDKIKYEKPPSIAQYVHSNAWQKYGSQKYYPDLKDEYYGWIKEVSGIRNKIEHRHIIKKMQGHIIFTYQRTSESSVKTTGNMIVGIPEYHVTSIENYVIESLASLKDLIESFFEDFSPEGNGERAS